MRTKKFLSEVMTMAWQFVKRNGFTMGEALKTAWANMKLKVQLSKRIVEFYFKKTDGTLRQAFGTLVSERIPETKGVKKTADNCQVYFDTENNHNQRKRGGHYSDRSRLDDAAGNVRCIQCVRL